MADDDAVAEDAAEDEAATEAEPKLPRPSPRRRSSAATARRSRGAAASRCCTRPARSSPTVVRTLRDDDAFAMCLDVCGVDYLTYDADRGLPAGVDPGALRGRGRR